MSSIKLEHIEHAIAITQQLSRREFLKYVGVSATLGGLAAAGLIGATLPNRVWAETPDNLRFIGADEYPVFYRLMQVMLPLAGSSFMPLDRVPVMQTLDAALLGSMPPHALHGLKLGIKLFEDGPIKTYAKRFSELSNQEAAAFCDAWADSEPAIQRGLVTALKKLVALAYWANPSTWSALGYDGPVSKRWGLKSLGNAPMPLA